MAYIPTAALSSEQLKQEGVFSKILGGHAEVSKMLNLASFETPKSFTEIQADYIAPPKAANAAPSISNLRPA